MQACLNVGVLASNADQLGEFIRLIQTAGHRACVSLDTSRTLPSDLPEADVWLASSNQAPIARALIDKLEASGAAIIFEEDGDDLLDEELAGLSPPEKRQKRARRLAAKLQLLGQGSLRYFDSGLARARSVWVLGASTGGPKAVAEFLAALPADLPGVAFIYVQHIDQNTIKSLRQSVLQACSYEVCVVDIPTVLRERTVYITPPSHQVDLLDGGILTPVHKPWAGGYSPSIDQVIAKVARVYAHNGGAIIFTGMGDDGARSCKFMHFRGGQIWVQNSASCAVDSMPVSVQSYMSPDQEGTPQQLASQLIRLMAQHHD